MEDFRTFAWFSDGLFLVFGILFLIFPKVIVKLSQLANQVLVYTDEKIYAIRTVAGIFCFAVFAFLTYVLLNY